jgi:predicted TIM-barrel fold metal-dependent hydrolase
MKMINPGDRIKKYRIIDTHLHLGSLANLNSPGGSDKQIVELLERHGIEKAIFSHHAALSTVAFGIEKTIEALQKYDGYLLCYLVFNPNFAAESLEILKRYKGTRYVAGIKIHPSWHACYPFDEKYDALWDFADKHGLVILTHSWKPDVANKMQRFSDPFFFGKILEKYPDIKLILAHAGGRGEYHYRVIELIEKYDNMYVDFSGDVFVPGLIEEYVRRAGSKKLLFGSDMPWIDIRYHLANIGSAGIGDSQKADIFGLNAVKLFGI